MKYSKKEQRDIEGYGDMTGPPEMARSKRKMMKPQVKRSSARKSKR